MDCSTPGLPVHHQLKLMSIASVIPSNYPILCRPLLLLPPIFSSIRVFSNELVLHIRWPKYWSFSFSISSSSEYLGLISFRMDWFDLLAVQKINSLTIIPRDFNIPFSIIHKTTRQTSKKIEDLDNTTISN